MAKAAQTKALPKMAQRLVTDRNMIVITNSASSMEFCPVGVSVVLTVAFGITKGNV